MSLQLNGTDGVTFNDGSEQWAAASPIGTKNLIINGDMRIAQRGTSVTGKTTGGFYTVDRFWTGGTTAGTWTITQDTDTPTGQGFATSLKMDCTTANASLSAGSYWYVEQKIEAQNCQHLKFGTSSAETLTLSFWVKSNKTGTYTFEIYRGDSGRDLSNTYTIDTADTWEKKTITINPDSTGVINNDNGEGLRCIFWVVAGTTFTSGTLATSWEAINNANRVSSSQVNLADSTSNYINITGVQLEVGDTATPFEHRPYDMELQRCYRYYQKIDATGSNYGFYSTGVYINSTGCRGVLPVENVFRAFPTVTFNGAFRVISNATRTVSAIALMTTSGTKPFFGFAATTSAGTQGYAGYLSSDADGATSIEFNAEL